MNTKRSAPHGDGGQKPKAREVQISPSSRLVLEVVGARQQLLSESHGDLEMPVANLQVSNKTEQKS